MNNKGTFFAKYAHHFFLIVVVVSLLSIVYSLWQNIVLNGVSSLSESHPHIEQDYRYFIDDSAEMELKEVVGKLNTFIASKPENIPFNLEGKRYWILLSLENPSDTHLSAFLHVDNAILAEFESFELDSTHRRAKPLSLPHHALVNTFPQVPVDLGAQSTRSILLKLRAAGPPNIPLVIYEASHFERKQLFTLVLYGAFVGIMLVMAIYNLVLFSAIKDKVYLFYVSYLLSTVVVIGSLNGFGYLVFPESVQLWLSHYLLFFNYALVIFILLFSLFFLRYDKSPSKLFWLGLLYTVTLLILSVVSLSLSHEYQAKLFFGMQPISIMIGLIIIAKRFNRHYGWARFYFLSWIPLIIGAAIQPLVLLNQLEYSFLTRNAFMIAVLIEITFMALALAERMKRFEIERLSEISYHPGTKIPRKVMVEKTITELLNKKDKRFSVLIIEPEQIERLALYVSDNESNALFVGIYKRLCPLFAYNDAIVALGNHDEKVSLLTENRLALIVDHQYSQQSLNILITSIQQLVEEAYQIEHLKLPLSALVGVAHYPEHGNSATKLLNRAQQALIKAAILHQKWSEFEPESEDKTAYYLNLAVEMKQAIEQESFMLYHQPQIDLKTMNVCGSEVLLRWEHPEHGFIPPDVFIPIAEDMGLINELTHWVFKQAIFQQQTLNEHGYTHMISINISGKDIAADDFYDFVEDMLKHHDMSATKIALELSASVRLSKNSSAISVLEKLNDLGITVSIDDFGNGNTSMAYVSELPFKELKVDRQFVENVCDDNKRKIIAETTVKMAKGLGLEVVAEGINSIKDERTLREFGCDIGQGFYYAKPMTLEDYIHWLAQQVNGRVKGFKSLKDDDVVEGEFISKNH